MPHPPQPPPFAADRHHDGSTVTVTASGELDMATCPELERELCAADGNGCRALVVDLARPTFIDSTGLRLLVETDARARAAGRRFVLAAPGPQARRLLELTGLADRLDLEPRYGEPQ